MHRVRTEKSIVTDTTEKTPNPLSLVVSWVDIGGVLCFIFLSDLGGFHSKQIDRIEGQRACLYLSMRSKISGMFPNLFRRLYSTTFAENSFFLSSRK